jgi:uncharacterized protein with GYD domain
VTLSSELDCLQSSPARSAVPYHLLLARYDRDTWGRVVNNPEDRMEASKAGAQDFGGKMLGYWYSAGRYDVYSLLEAPDLLTAAALHAALFSSGAFLEFNHTVLMSVAEMQAAVAKSWEWPTLRDYRPPGTKQPAE